MAITTALRLCASVAAAGLMSAPAAPARADDAAFGCKVLLCAAATNPAWQGIAYCAPVMNQLFSLLNSGGGWPSCPQANVSGVTSEPYQACAPPELNYAIGAPGDRTCDGARCGINNPGIPDGHGGFSVATGRNAAPIPVTATAFGPYCADPRFVACPPGQTGGLCALTSGALDPASANPNPDCVRIAPEGASSFQFCFNPKGQ